MILNTRVYISRLTILIYRESYLILSKSWISFHNHYGRERGFKSYVPYLERSHKGDINYNTLKIFVESYFTKVSWLNVHIM